MNLDPIQKELLSKFETSANKVNSFKNRYFSMLFVPSLYIYGDVGRGKTFLMKEFYNKVSVPKLFIHYQAFISDIHKKTWEIGDKTLLLEKVITKYYKDYKVICIDELEIKDIVDAMIIGKIFSLFLKYKIYIVITSNFKPDDLYKDGLQRESFLPFISMIKEKFEIFHLDHNIDYRLTKIKSDAKKYFYPLNAKNMELINNIRSEVIEGELEPQNYQTFGRKFTLNQTYKEYMITDFQEICGIERAASEYIIISEKFRFIILANVPILTDDDINLVIRFIQFIDNLYLKKVILFILAETDIDELYKGKKLAKEFKRTVSRIKDMQSEDYYENAKKIHNF